MCGVLLIPDPESRLTSSESGEVNVLAVVHDVRLLVTIEIRALRCLSPCKIEF